MSVASILAKLGLDNSEFLSKLEQSKKKPTELQQVMGDLKKAIAEAFVGGAVLSFAKKAIDAADDIQDLSEKIKVSGKTIQTLKIYAEQTGNSFGTFETAILKITRSATEAQAATGETGMTRAFKSLGISVDDLRGKSPEQLFDLVTRKLYESRDSADANKEAYTILGRGAGELMEALKDLGKDGVAKLSEEFDKQGRLVSDSTTKQLADAKEFMEKTQGQWTTFWAEILGGWASMWERIGTISAEGFAGLRDAGFTAEQKAKADREKGEADRRKKWLEGQEQDYQFAVKMGFKIDQTLQENHELYLKEYASRTQAVYSETSNSGVDAANAVANALDNVIRGHEQAAISAGKGVVALNEQANVLGKIVEMAAESGSLISLSGNGYSGSISSTGPLNPTATNTITNTTTDESVEVKPERDVTKPDVKPPAADESAAAAEASAGVATDLKSIRVAVEKLAGMKGIIWK